MRESQPAAPAAAWMINQKSWDEAGPAPTNRLPRSLPSRPLHHIRKHIMSEARKNLGARARPGARRCRALVLSPAGEAAPNGRSPAAPLSGSEGHALRAWVRRYVALVAEADAATRASSGKEAHGP